MDFSLRMTQHDDAALFALGAMQIYSEQGPFSRAIELADLILSKEADLDPQLQIRMLLQQARAHRWAARSEDAKTKLEKAFSIAVKVNDQESEGTVLTQLGGKLIRIWGQLKKLKATADVLCFYTGNIKIVYKKV